MTAPPRSSSKLVKRRPLSFQSPERALSIDPTPTASPVPSPSEQIDDLNLGMPSNKASAAEKGEKEKRSKWCLSNPLHSKDKDRKDGGPDTELPDSAYASSEPNNFFSEVDTNGMPSFSSSDHGRHRPVSQARPLVGKYAGSLKSICDLLPLRPQSHPKIPSQQPLQRLVLAAARPSESQTTSPAPAPPTLMSPIPQTHTCLLRPQ